MKLFPFKTALAVLLSLVVVTPSTAFASFPDVSSSNPYFDAINRLQELGVVKGQGDTGKYGPNDFIDRAAFTKIVTIASLGEAPSIAATQCFPDVAIDTWYHQFVCYMASKGLIKGYPDGKFEPGWKIKFVEAAKIILNAFGIAVEAEEDPDQWYRPFVKKMAELNAIPSSITFFDQKITRGQMAEMIYRVMDKITSKPSQTYEALSFEAAAPAPTPTPTPTPTPAPAAKTVTKNIQDIGFGGDITVNVGDTIVWTNKDPVPHTVTSDDGGPLKSAFLNEGEKYISKFTQAGTFSYFCQVHPAMKARVIVK